MPDVNSIPFRKAGPDGHYRSKQLPNDSAEFMVMLGLPATAGDVVSSGSSTDNQATVFAGGSGKTIRPASETGLAKLSSGVLSAVAAPNGTVVGTTDVQTLTNKTLTNPIITGLTGLTKADVGLANVDNTSDANKPVSTAQQTALNLKENTANKGINSGYASLDSSGKVPLAQIPDSVVGASQYQGTWNAATNSPAIPAAAIGNKGWYYSVSVAGSTSINGINVWAVGDQIISNGTVWQKIPNSDAVNSVNGQVGVVVLTKSDVGLSNVDNTSDVNKPVSSATTTQLNLKEATANKGVANGYAALDATGKVPAAQAPADLVTSVAGRQGVVVLTKSDVGLANVDNTSDATYSASSTTLTNKTINGANNTLTVRLANDVTGNLPVTNLNAGTGANSSSYWRGDGVWAPPAGGGDVVGPAGGVVDGEVVSYNATTGKIIKASAGKLSANLVTGPASATSGNLATFNGTTGKIVQDSGKLATDLVVGPASSVDGEVALFSGTGGKLLKRSTKLVVADTVTTGYAAGTVVVPSLAYSADQAFTGTPSALDDHFEGSALNAKWTAVSMSVPSYPTKTVAGSKLTLGGMSANASDGVFYGHEISTPLPNNNDFTLTLQIDAILSGLYPRVASTAVFDFYIYNDTNNVGSSIRFESFWTTGQSGASSAFAVMYGSGVSTTAAYWFLSGDYPKYVRFKWIKATTMTEWYYSTDGVTFVELWDASGGSTGLTSSAYPQSCHIMGAGKNQGTYMVQIDWVKFTNP